MQALLRQLVQQVGVAPADITFYDAVRDVPATIFDRGTKEFPGVHFVDSTGTDGREKAVPDKTKPLVLGQGDVTLYFPTCVTAGRLHDQRRRAERAHPGGHDGHREESPGFTA